MAQFEKWIRARKLMPATQDVFGEIVPAAMPEWIAMWILDA